MGPIAPQPPSINPISNHPEKRLNLNIFSPAYCQVAEIRCIEWQFITYAKFWTQLDLTHSTNARSRNTL
jgi:hypothetical protein